MLAAHRSPENYLAGASVLHRSDDSPRYSEDLDFFHDIEGSVRQSAEADASVLQDSGLKFEWLLRTSTFCRGVVTVEGKALKLEWAQDAAFRFFPAQADAFCGYRLHDTDAAINKILALAGRSAIRDFLDVLHLHRTSLTVGALAWAACGKDPGFTPQFLLDQAGRHTAYTQENLRHVALREPLDLKALKRVWLEAVDQANRLVAALPPADLGCLYLAQDGTPVTPDPQDPCFARLRRHFGSVRGTWPTVSPYPAGQ